MKTGTQLITEERGRQMKQEGYTPEHDDQHTDNSLACAALCYASPYPVFHCYSQPHQGYAFRCPWPWEIETFKPTTLRTHPNPVQARIRDLVKAGALIAAEIDRLQRLDS